MKPIILIVDDEKHTREGLRDSLEDAFDVYIAADSSGALGVLERESVDLVLTDLRLGGEGGMELVDQILALPHPPIVIMMTAYGSVDIAVEAMKRGAYDFVAKPLNIDRLEILIRRALRSRKVEREVVELHHQVDKKFGLERLLGSSPAMEEVFATIKQVAPTRATVLIQGGSGTGKELVAQALHTLSGRPKAKFVAVHCAALSPQLLESELFGHERGAFTGAIERRIGRFEQANGGTLFLDEIGEIDPATQVKLLRVLGEERTFERVGGNTPIKVDVRLVSATNKNLEELVRQEKFRADLFFRLSVVPITLPLLSQRQEDIPILVAAFLKSFSEENQKPLPTLSPDAMQAILDHHWPGNVRELRTAIEHGVVMAKNGQITLKDLPAGVRSPSPIPTTPTPTPTYHQPLQPSLPPLSLTPDHFNLHNTEHRLIIQALEKTAGNVTRAAEQLGISRRTLHRKIKELKIHEDGDRN